MGGWNVSIFIFYISAFFFSLVDNIKSHRQAKKKIKTLDVCMYVCMCRTEGMMDGGMDGGTKRRA